jgi:hypothetical protein
MCELANHCVQKLRSKRSPTPNTGDGARSTKTSSTVPPLSVDRPQTGGARFCLRIIWIYVQLWSQYGGRSINWPQKDTPPLLLASSHGATGNLGNPTVQTAVTVNVGVRPATGTVRVNAVCKWQNDGWRRGRPWNDWTRFFGHHCGCNRFYGCRCHCQCWTQWSGNITTKCCPGDRMQGMAKRRHSISAARL